MNVVTDSVYVMNYQHLYLNEDLTAEKYLQNSL